MKYIFTIGCILWLNSKLCAQATQHPNTSCSTKFSVKELALVYSDSISSDCNTLEISDLKPYLEGVFSVKPELNIGVYTFTKGKNLEIPKDYHVCLEDKLTGKKFNLTTSNDYTFKVSQPTTDRFILHIEKLNSKTDNETVYR